MDGKRRVTAVTDIIYDPKTAQATLRNIFDFKQKAVTGKGEILGEWTMDKRKPSFYQKFEKRMVKLPDGFFDNNPPINEMIN
jgi:hypothetical protein